MLARPTLIIIIAVAATVALGGAAVLATQLIIGKAPSQFNILLSPVAPTGTADDAESEPEVELEPEVETEPTPQPEPAPAKITSPTGNQSATPSRPRITTTKARNILFLGSDRRSPGEVGRTDTIMLISIVQDERKILLTSLPRDLWIDGQKINGFFASNGFATLRDKIIKITGLDAESYIMADFDATVWAVDQLGGVPVNVLRSFTDYGYPADRNEVTVPLHFDGGEQTLAGETALAYCRSRKGDNNEGSDFQRMRRQQNLVQALPRAFRESSLVELSAEALYELIQGHIQTNLKIDDLVTLLPIVLDYPNYSESSVVLDTGNFLYHPPTADYGGAYVLRPVGNSFAGFQDFLLEKLGR